MIDRSTVMQEQFGEYRRSEWSARHTSWLLLG
jgi:hypothetical protein